MYRVIGWTGREGKGKIMPLEDALSEYGPRNIFPVVEYIGRFWEDPRTDDAYGSPLYRGHNTIGIMVRVGWAKKMGLITPEEYARAKGK